MVRKLLHLSCLFAFGVLTISCGKPAGPDQTLVAPAGWTIIDHPFGDLHYSKWFLLNGDSTKMELTSFVAPGAPEETLKKMEVWKGYMEESVQYGQYVSKSWRSGKYEVVRYFAFAHPNDTDHGTVNLWLVNQDREFAITISNPRMTRVPLTALADKAADDFAKANEGNLK